MNEVKSGDNIYVESISRLGRNVDDLRKLTTFFREKEVVVHFVKEGFSTDGNMYKFLLTILGAVVCAILLISTVTVVAHQNSEPVKNLIEQNEKSHQLNANFNELIADSNGVGDPFPGDAPDNLEEIIENLNMDGLDNFLQVKIL